MHYKTRSVRAGNTRARTWARPLAAAALALCAGAAIAQVASYDLSYDKLLKTSSILLADENAAFEPITGGVKLADGGAAAVTGGTTFGVGYSEYELISGFFGIMTHRPKSFQGNAAFVGNAGSGDGGASDAQFQVSGVPALCTGPGYPIGFDFEFNGESFDRVGISAQGWIGFGHSSNGSEAVAVYTAQTSNSTYLPLNNTLLAGDSRRNRVVATGVSGGGTSAGTTIMPIVYSEAYPDFPGAELRYETIGSAPNRVFVVQWLNYGYAINTLDQHSHRRMNFQIRLYEGTNEVEVRFGKVWRGAGTPGVFQTGLGGKSGGSGVAGNFSSFGFYDQNDNIWRGWPYSWTSQDEHTGYPGSTEFGQRILGTARKATPLSVHTPRQRNSTISPSPGPPPRQAP